MQATDSNRVTVPLWKKLLIAGLLSSLLIVVVVQSMPAAGAPSAVSVSPAAVPTESTEIAANKPLTGPAAWQHLKSILPEVDLAQLMAHQPFRRLETVLNSTPTAADSILIGQSGDGDPTGPAMGPASNSPPLISAILHGSGRPAVLIDGRLYYEQDLVHERWRIMSISAERVALANEGHMASHP
jgi:hypothetical protein